MGNAIIDKQAFLAAYAELVKFKASPSLSDNQTMAECRVAIQAYLNSFQIKGD